MLPSEIFDYFSVVGVKRTSTETHIHLDGLMNSALFHEVNFESKGFMEAVSVTDFPICDHEVFLKIAAVAGRVRVQARVSVFLLTLMSFVKVPVTSRNLVLFKRDVWRHLR